MHDAGFPTKFFHRFDGSAGKKYAAFVVCFRRQVGFQSFVRSALEVVFVVDEIYLHSCWLQRGDFDDQRMVGVVDDQVHAGKTDHFVQLVSAFVYTSVFGHECAHLEAPFLDSFRNFQSGFCHFRFGEIRHDFLIEKQNSVVHRRV